MSKKKIRIGIELNEVIRNRYITFDRYYYDEFGNDGIPDDNPYVFNFFTDYKWEDTEEEIKYLKDDVPEELSPIEYHKDDGNNKNADDLIFETKKEKKTAKERFNQFMYVDYCYEIHGTAPLMYSNLNVDLQILFKKYEEIAEFILYSDDNEIAIPSTLFFLSKNNIKFKNIKFYDDLNEAVKEVDFYITANPNLKVSRLNKRKIIKVLRPFNEEKSKEKHTILQLKEILEENDVFSKLFTKKFKLKNILN
jgi:hypothetical protein